jgi:diguanylate cyclase (GGDEF)-like protein
MKANRPDDFPGSPYAAELVSGVSKLRFQPAVESSFLTIHLDRVRLRARIWCTLTTILAAGAALGEIRRAGLSSAFSLLHWAIHVPCGLALVWLAWRPQFGKYYLSLSAILMPVFNALVGVFIAVGLARGRIELLAGLTVDLIAIFFFTGLLFRQACVTSAITFLAFAITAMVAGVEGIELLKIAALMALTSATAAAVYLDVEQTYRRTFLEGALLRELVARDGLTWLANRRAFDAHLLSIWQQALRDRRSIALLMIDIDHFKLCNDTYGHQSGDLVLRSIAQVIQEFARRPLDLAARYGGEEFAMILYDLALPHVEDIAERLRARVQDLPSKPAEQDASLRPSITVSIGVAFVTPTLGRTPQGIVQMADEALYDAKQAGRNRVESKGMDAYQLLDTGAFKGRGKR